MRARITGRPRTRSRVPEPARGESAHDPERRFASRAATPTEQRWWWVRLGPLSGAGE
jgi:hypothetical protein